ncbi:MAG: DUF2922 family protein [Defluviitaleaceae bacterium]|nr:DUF2922 family protein [Defluviitaleaceae bacterium]
MTHYRMTFAAEGGARRSIKITNVNPSITPQELRAAADMLITHDIMDPARGRLTRLLTLTAHTVSVSRLLG